MTSFRVFTILLLALMVPTIGCHKASDEPGSKSTSVIDTHKQDAETDVSVDLDPDLIDSKDRPFLVFGQYLEVKELPSHDPANPHEVAAHAIWMCSQGKTTELLQQMHHVETDVGLGEAFLSFLEDFGPDLEQFRDDKLKLKFQAYGLTDDTSVWYYYLFDADGKQLEHSPWVSLHRSRSTGRCALTGIFLFDADIGEPGPIPKGLVTNLDRE